MRVVADAYKVGLRRIVAEDGQDTDVGLRCCDRSRLQR